jgi:hypothetical protein
MHIARGGKLEGKLSIHCCNQPHWISAVWNFIGEEELKRRRNLGIFHYSNIRGITQDKVMSIGLTGSSVEKGNTRDNTRGNFVRGSIDGRTIDRGSTRGSVDIEEAIERQRRQNTRGNIDRGNTRGNNIDKGSVKGNISDWSEGNFTTIIVSLIAKMAQRSARERSEEELVEDNFSTTQQLALCLDSHSSTLTFTLDTLAQHCTLIN